MTYLRAVLVLLSWVTATIGVAFALTSGPAHLALGFGGVAAVSAITAWGLTLKATADMERWREEREQVWARRFEEAQWRDSFWEERELLQLPERFDAG